jgi:hypothetical protein
MDSEWIYFVEDICNELDRRHCAVPFPSTQSIEKHLSRKQASTTLAMAPVYEAPVEVRFPEKERQFSGKFQQRCIKGRFCRYFNCRDSHPSDRVAPPPVGECWNDVDCKK